MIREPERLREAWREWVTANLGPDPHRADLAAEAGAGAALEGLGFEAASAAARQAWQSSVTRTSAPATLAAVPIALRVAMFTAIGGCIASIALALGLAVAFLALAPLAIAFGAYNLFVAALSGLLLRRMRRRDLGAWRVAVALVVLGIAFDVVEQVLIWMWAGAGSNGYTAFFAFPAMAIGLGVGTPLYLLGLSGAAVSNISSNWMAIHLLTIQLPILAGLFGARRWIAPRGAAVSDSAGTPDAVS